MRNSPDRRTSPTPIISRYTFFGGKRMTVRRGGDKKKHLFVDIYSARLLIAILLILGLSCVDALLTLSLIKDGKLSLNLLKNVISLLMN